MSSGGVPVGDEWTFLPNVEVVTITPNLPPAAPITGAKAIRRVLTDKELQGLGSTLAISPLDLVFNIWPSTITGGYVPVDGDFVTDAANVNWVIITIDLRTISTRYRAVCRREVK